MFKVKNYYTAFGETKSLKEWASFAGLTQKIIACRLKNGWSIERAVTAPKQPRYPATLCWSCKNAFGGCNWSAYCIGLSDNPVVEGWEAEEKHKPYLTDSVSFDDNGLVYHVYKCPEYIPD